jgi:hypothetical protein
MRMNCCFPIVFLLVFCLKAGSQTIENKDKRPTVVSIEKDKFLINGEILNQGKVWEGHEIEGLLFNSRMVQAVFDDENPNTRVLWKYPDTQTWDPERNTDEFIGAMEQWKSYGLNSFTLNMQGGSPTGYGNKDWINSAYDHSGNIKPAYWNRLNRVLKKADELQMVVILGLFYFGQDQILNDEKDVINAVDNTLNALHKSNYKNVIIEIANECDLPYYDHAILKETRIVELINRVRKSKKKGFRYLVSTSFKGGTIPNQSVLKASDLVLLHGNGVENPSEIATMIAETRQQEGYSIKPIVFNEDDHYDYDKEANNCKVAVQNYASWGFFDFRRDGETAFEEGFQSIPVDWKLNSKRKMDFFKYIKTIVNDKN